MATPNGLDSRAWFEWGTNSTLPFSTSPQEVGSGFGVVRVTCVISNLIDGIPYHFRLVVSNETGVTFGLEQLFTTSGTVVAWGGAVNNWRQSIVPTRLGNIVGIAGGDTFSVVLMRDGRLRSWGTVVTLPNVTNAVAVSSGQSTVVLKADGSVAGNGWLASPPAALTNAVAVSSGSSHALGLRADGVVFAWGSTSLGKGTVPAGLSNVVSVATGRDHSVALKADGTVSLWGSTQYGQTTPPAGLTNIVAIAAGEYHNLALRADGQVLGWGQNDYGQLDVPPGLTNVVALGCGFGFSVALQSDGLIATWGKDFKGGYFAPARGAVAIACGTAHALSLNAGLEAALGGTQPAVVHSSTDATLHGAILPRGFPTVAWFEWGRDLTYGNTTPQVDVGNKTNYIRIAASLVNLERGAHYHSRLVVSNAHAVTYGGDVSFTMGQCIAMWGRTPAVGAGQFSPAQASNVVQTLAGLGFGLMLMNDKTVQTWGETDYANSPPAGVSNVVQIAAGAVHAVYLLEDGGLLSWGSDGVNQLPKGAVSNMIAVSAGAYHSTGLRENGTVADWGVGSVPYFLSNVVAISAGQIHGLALRLDGTVIGWGNNEWGQASVPGGLVDVVAISAGYSHNLALLRDGTVVGWGLNQYGQSKPPPGLTNVIAIATGDDHSVALKSDGTVVAWGWPGYSTWASKIEPPLGLRDAVAIAAGANCSIALGPKSPPVALDSSHTGYVNHDLMVRLRGFDPNFDPVTFRVLSLPVAGTLFQCEADNRGAAINQADTVVTDALGRVIYVPATDALGTPLDSFAYRSSDEWSSSAQASAALNIVLPPAPVFVSAAWTNGAFDVIFTGNANARYRVWTSTNLVEWDLLGPATMVSPGTFKLTFTPGDNSPQRFYRAGAP